MTTEASRDDDLDLKWPILAGLALILVLWSVPAGVSWLHDGTVPPLGSAVAGTVKLVSQHPWHEPASAYPVPVRVHMPAGPVWWWGATLTLGSLVAAALAVWRAVDVRMSQTVLGRRSHELRGARPRAWARSRDLGDAPVRARQADRFTLGALDGRLLASDHESHVIVVAPTRSGKTTRCVIPWLLEHEGPAIVTSTKTDVLTATRSAREKMGRVSVWDPFGLETVNWSSLAGCEEWSMALRQATWLADSVQEGNSEIAAYWRGEAARLLAPLMHAAALGQFTMAHITTWIDSHEGDEPLGILRAADAEAAAVQLKGILRLDDRNRGTIFMSAGSLLAAYRYPELVRTGIPGLSAAGFLDGGNNTLYVVAPSRQQRLLAPLVVSMLSSILALTAERANQDGPLEPTLRVLMDEAANIAPIRDLPSHLSQAAGHGVRVATLWQSLAQLQQRYGAGADDILANSAAKLFLGPITDRTTIGHLRDVLGDEQPGFDHARPVDVKRVPRQPKATAAALHQLAADRALLLDGRSSPAVVRLNPWWNARDLARA